MTSRNLEQFNAYRETTVILLFETYFERFIASIPVRLPELILLAILLSYCCYPPAPPVGI